MASQCLEDVRALLEVVEVAPGLYRGPVEDPGWRRVFGGLVFAQPLAAAMRTVPQDRLVRSTETTFVRPARTDLPLEHQVEALADGRRTNARRVTSRQDGKIVATTTASFHVATDGLDHQRSAPVVAPPSSFPSELEMMSPFRELVHPSRREDLVISHAFEHRMRPALDHPTAPSKMPPHREVWIRGKGTAPEGRAWSTLLAAYVSDYVCFSTVLLPHGVTWMTPGWLVVTLRHAMFFHAPLAVDDWFLHVVESPRAAGERGIAMGQMYTRDGVLAATTLQEGLARYEPSVAETQGKA